MLLSHKALSLESHSPKERAENATGKFVIYNRM
jgi:hypothetical protein